MNNVTKDDVMKLIYKCAENKPGIDSSTDYLRDGYFDSLSMMNLVNEIEDHYGIELGIADIEPENFVNMNSIYEMITKKVGQN